MLSQKTIELVVGKKLQLCVSANLEEEIFRKLNKLNANEEIIANVILLLKSSVAFKPQIIINVCRDPKDNYLLELAETSKADYLITRDKDLLELPNQRWKKTKILKPDDFLPLLRKMGMFE